MGVLSLLFVSVVSSADFERQIIILNGGKGLSDRRYRQSTDEAVRLILGSVGL